MGWNFLLIFFIVALVLSAVGFKKFVYFLSLGYGLAVAGIGVAMTVMSLMGLLPAKAPHYIMFALFVVYGFRLSGFLLIREIKNSAYRKTLAAATGDDSKMPVFVKIAIWLCVAVLYVAQTSGVYFRLLNGGEVSALFYVGMVISVLAIILESAADRQKSAQKAKRPDMVAMEGLYRIVRCPNYLGEILFWTGVLVGSLDTLTGVGQWITVILAYISIVYIMFNGAERLEKRQVKRYGDNEEYRKYTDKTPIIIPLVPIYHLAKEAKQAKR